LAKDQRIRAALFYLSVVVFFTGLPFILSFTLGYKFDPVRFKFTTTGLISLKTTPAGAVVFLNGAQLNDRTPCSINELLPGKYHIELQLAGYYPYAADAEVSARKVTRMEKILLFPLLSDIQQLNKEPVSWFWIEEGKGSLFFPDQATKTVFRSDLQGEHFEPLSEFIPLEPPARSWKFSPDRRRLLYHNQYNVGVICLEPGSETGQQAFLLDYRGKEIRDIFWYSDNYHVIIVDGLTVLMMETRPGAQPFTLMTLRSNTGKVFYEPEQDAVFFQDAQQGVDGKYYENVYRLEIGKKLFPFRDFMRPKPNERVRE
jgi:hypothetical protein